MKSISSESQTGSVHVVIIAVLVVALIGALGFIFWSNFLQPKLSTESSSNNADSVPVASKALVSETPSTQAPSTESSKSDTSTITLTDWKVKFTIPKSLTNTSVKYSKQNKTNAVGYGFTTSRIEKLGGDCETQPYGKTVLLSRATEIPSNAMDGFGRINQKKINGYYYTYSQTIPSCSGGTDVNGKVSQVEIDDASSLVELLKSLKPIE